MHENKEPKLLQRSPTFPSWIRKGEEEHGRRGKGRCREVKRERRNDDGRKGKREGARGGVEEDRRIGELGTSPDFLFYSLTTV